VPTFRRNMEYNASIWIVDYTTYCEAACSSETSVHVSATLHGVTYHKTVIFTLTPIRRSNLIQIPCYVYLIPPSIQVMYRSATLSRSWIGRHKSATMFKTGTFYTKSKIILQLVYKYCLLFMRRISWLCRTCLLA
jgi:hypothetical protein